MHAGRRIAAQAGGDAIGAARTCLREEATQIDERQERGEHHLAGPNLTAWSANDRVVEPFVHVRRPRELEDLCPVGGEGAGEGGGVAARMEVGLVVEAQGELDRERQVDVGGQRGRQPKPHSSGVFGFEGLPVVGHLGVDERGRPFELAVGRCLVGEAFHRVDRLLVGLRVLPRLALAVLSMSAA